MVLVTLAMSQILKCLFSVVDWFVLLMQFCFVKGFHLKFSCFDSILGFFNGGFGLHFFHTAEHIDLFTQRLISFAQVLCSNSHALGVASLARIYFQVNTLKSVLNSLFFFRLHALLMLIDFFLFIFLLFTELFDCIQTHLLQLLKLFSSIFVVLLSLPIVLSLCYSFFALHGFQDGVNLFALCVLLRFQLLNIRFHFEISCCKYFIKACPLFFLFNLAL